MNSLPLLRFSPFQLKEGAIFVADLHWRPGEPSLPELINLLLKKRPSQLIFAGDIFHLLLDFPELVEWNREGIEGIWELSREIELYYLEGNHDFGVSKILPGVGEGLYSKEQQIIVHHGDWGEGIGYSLYRRVIRKKVTQLLLHYGTGNWMNGWLFRKLLRKDVRIPAQFPVSQLFYRKNWRGLLIEGHYHTGGGYFWRGERGYLALPCYYSTGKVATFDKNKFYFEKIN
ncbi:MAG: metallophosphoesterase [Campylobacterales bacterium]